MTVLPKCNLTGNPDFLQKQIGSLQFMILLTRQTRDLVEIINFLCFDKQNVFSATRANFNDSATRRSATWVDTVSHGTDPSCRTMSCQTLSCRKSKLLSHQNLFEQDIQTFCKYYRLTSIPDIVYILSLPLLPGYPGC